MRANRKGVLWVVALTVFLDMVGFSVIFPLFPGMLEYYVEREGPESLIGRLAASLAAWLGEQDRDTSFAVITLFGGVLGSLYSVLQFLFAPIWGAVSDRFGRRRTLLFTLAGTALSYVLWFFAGSFALLAFARLVGGAMAGNISTATAVVADTHSGEERAKGMGIVGAAIGMGFVFGPALGGMSSSWNVLAIWPAGEAFGVNPFSACALIALGLTLVNLLWAWTHLPETLPAQEHGKSHGARTLNPVRALGEVDFPGVRATNLAYFLYVVAVGAMEFTITFLAVDRLDFSPVQNAWMFVYLGLLIAFVQGGVVRRVVPRLGERAVSRAGMLLTIPGFVIVGAARSTGELYLGLGFLAVGTALAAMFTFSSCSVSGS